MEILRAISAQYHPRHIWNMDESGLFFRMGPQRSYLTGAEVRQETRGIQFGKHKDRITVVLACNSDDSHILPVRYIGSAANLRCFRTKKYESQASRYWLQKNGWMDSDGLVDWLKWWYEEVKKKSTGPWLLIMDNCGGHESEIILLGGEN